VDLAIALAQTRVSRIAADGKWEQLRAARNASLCAFVLAVWYIQIKYNA
jgi:hypothetical protein